LPCHHAELVQQWLARLGCWIKLHFIPSYCPHLNPQETERRVGELRAGCMRNVSVHQAP
jgi:hypothetical protein